MSLRAASPPRDNPPAYESLAPRRRPRHQAPGAAPRPAPRAPPVQLPPSPPPSPPIGLGLQFTPRGAFSPSRIQQGLPPLPREAGWEEAEAEADLPPYTLVSPPLHSVAAFSRSSSSHLAAASSRAAGPSSAHVPPSPPIPPHTRPPRNMFPISPRSSVFSDGSSRAVSPATLPPATATVPPTAARAISARVASLSASSLGLACSAPTASRRPLSDPTPARRSLDLPSSPAHSGVSLPVSILATPGRPRARRASVRFEDELNELRIIPARSDTPPPRHHEPVTPDLRRPAEDDDEVFRFDPDPGTETEVPSVALAPAPAPVPVPARAPAGQAACSRRPSRHHHQSTASLSSLPVAAAPDCTCGDPLCRPPPPRVAARPVCNCGLASCPGGAIAAASGLPATPPPPGPRVAPAVPAAPTSDTTATIVTAARLAQHRRRRTSDSNGTSRKRHSVTPPVWRDHKPPSEPAPASPVVEGYSLF